MKKSLKILALSGWYPNESDPQLGIFIQHQLEAISKEHEVTLIQLKPSRQLPTKEQVIENGVKVVRYTYVVNQYPSRFLSWYVKWMSIIQDFRMEKFDLIHLHIAYPLAIPALAFQKELGIPLLLSEQWSGYRTSQEYKGFVRKWITSKLVNRASAIVVLSSFLQRSMESRGLDGNYFRIPNLVKLHGKSAVPERSNRIRIMHVGDHIDSTKNISGLLRAFKLAHSKNPDLQLIQIGDGPDSAKLKKLAVDLELGENIRWLGRLTQPEVVDLIQMQCDIGVTNSHVETFSVVSFEFLACEKPLIVTKCGGPEDYLPDGFGIMIPVNDDQALASALLKMSFEYTQFEGGQIREKVLKEFSEETFMSKMNYVYKQVLT